MQSAPLFAEIARGPEGGSAFWITARDGLRLRAGHWPPPGPARGTVLLLPGRSEYIEKYGPTAAALGAQGWHLLVIDWRGQGLSDRLHPDPLRGHVADFRDYQQDVQALLALARDLDLPEPLHLISHSMGGCIALRALHEGLPVRSAVFSAPMWGIQLLPTLQPLAATVSRLAHDRRLGHRLTPTTSRQSYISHVSFRRNLLTRDAEMFQWLRQHVTAHPELALGGPSLSWLHAALSECKALAMLASPALPAVTALGSRERIICPRSIRRRMASWPEGRLDLYLRAEHEVIMETAPHRDRFHRSAAALFAAHA